MFRDHVFKVRGLFRDHIFKARDVKVLSTRSGFLEVMSAISGLFKGHIFKVRVI